METEFSEGVRSLRTVLLDNSTPSGVIEATLDLLDDQWPHERSLRESRYASIQNGSHIKLPIHVTLIFEHGAEGMCADQSVVSYAKLQGAYGKDYGHSAIVYSVVVKKELRGNGYGKRIMSECELVARNLGLSYLYLYTDDKVGFYKHLGYLECEPISSLGQNAKRLKPSQIEALEGIFAKRLNCEESKSSTQTWLRKRLVKTLVKRSPCEWTKLCSIAAHAVKSYQTSTQKSSSTLMSSSKDTSCSKNVTMVYIEVAHEQQVGPMCGITALNMGISCIDRNCTATTRKDCECAAIPCGCCGEINVLDQPDNIDNILDFAINLGITGDGELFCAYNLAYLCQSWYSAPSYVLEIRDQESFMKHLLISLKSGSPVLIAYDRDVGGFLPTQNSGKSAHWAVICGILYDRGDIKYESGKKVYKDDSFHLWPITRASSSEFREAIDMALTLLTGNDFFLVCVHGMSRLPFVCHVSSMLASNENLLHCGNKCFKAPSVLEHLSKRVVFLMDRAHLP